MDHYVAWFLLICPLAATIAILVRWHKVPEYAIGASIGSSVLCFLIAIGVFCGAVPVPNSFMWIDLPGFQVDFSMILDPLAKGMLLVVTGVGMLVHIFSYGYMEHDPSKGRFFGGLSIFMFSMTGIVLSSNLIMLFIFWEGVGFSSYLLVGFWYERESAAQAANKAFICNRLADFGFMTGILLFWFLMGTVSVEPNVLAGVYAYHHAMPWVGSILTDNTATAVSNQPASFAQQFGFNTKNPWLLYIMVFGLFCGCIGKSAMFPLHVWLPDAMEGPTPVSALIHAATMVAAGVYMLCRCFPLLILSEGGMLIIASIGCLTSVMAALIAVQQNDIKRILAYSTLSQLGYMVMAVGCYAPDAAMFHLTTHAFFKALLFLGAGSVIHALHEEQDIWKMGGLLGKIPLTGITFLIGMLALSGIYPFAGFWSKDYLLSLCYLRSPFFYGVGVFTAFLTAFYMTRLVVIAFFGPARTKAAEHPHESPWHMTTPLVILAVLSCIGGVIGLKGFYNGWSTSVADNIHFVAPFKITEPSAFLEMILPLATVVLGIGCAWALYYDAKTDPLERFRLNLLVFKPYPFRILANKFYFDDIYDNYIVVTQQMVARSLAWIDSWIIDGLIIRGAAYVCVGFGELLRLFQTGNLQAYAYVFTLGGIILIYFTLFH